MNLPQAWCSREGSTIIARFRHFGVRQQYPPVYGHQRHAWTIRPYLVKPTVCSAFAPHCLT
jgi:hypothetical protein